MLVDTPTPHSYRPKQSQNLLSSHGFNSNIELKHYDKKEVSVGQEKLIDKAPDLNR